MFEDLKWLMQHGAGSPDFRTARNVLEILVPSARRVPLLTADESAAIDAAERQARANLEALQ